MAAPRSLDRSWWNRHGKVELWQFQSRVPFSVEKVRLIQEPLEYEMTGAPVGKLNHPLHQIESLHISRD
ncbi:protein of unknown function [Sterolibacterium denitrificans]|uniref:Uncharacterized protein n=1 Tax=Sterolibacterium denitrificans TaxID=157592 RepID=A0A7Z7HRT9_9PROT|nr:protein of unknown function [Sterolibacterium denitrificans]